MNYPQVHRNLTTLLKPVFVSRAAIASSALLLGACSATQPTNTGDEHNPSRPDSEMQMHIFACDDGSSIVTGVSADTFLVDVVGATREGREKLVAPRSSVRTVNGRIAVKIGQDTLHLEPINQQGINEHLSFRGKSCWR